MLTLKEYLASPHVSIYNILFTLASKEEIAKALIECIEEMWENRKIKTQYFKGDKPIDRIDTIKLSNYTSIREISFGIFTFKSKKEWVSSSHSAGRTCYRTDTAERDGFIYTTYAWDCKGLKDIVKGFIAGIKLELILPLKYIHGVPVLQPQKERDEK